MRLSAQSKGIAKNLMIAPIARSSLLMEIAPFQQKMFLL
jgi:hypothetical protein